MSLAEWQYNHPDGTKQLPTPFLRFFSAIKCWWYRRYDIRDTNFPAIVVFLLQNWRKPQVAVIHLSLKYFHRWISFTMTEYAWQDVGSTILCIFHPMGKNHNWINTTFELMEYRNKFFQMNRHVLFYHPGGIYNFLLNQKRIITKIDLSLRGENKFPVEVKSN